MKKPKKAEPEVLLGEGGPTEAGYHSIESMLQCPKKYQLQHVRGIRQPQHVESEAFAVGILYHAARAHWFALRFATDAKAWASIKETMRKAAMENKLPVTLKAEQRAFILIEQYAAFWLKRPRPTPVAAEYLLGPATILPNDPFSFRTARLDDVSRYPEANGQLCIGESKTTSTSIDDTVNQYELHGQTMLQYVLWKMAPQGEAMHGPVAGIILDVAKKPYGNDKAKFGRTFIQITDHQIAWFVKSLGGYLRAAAGIDWDADAPRNVSACTYLAGRARVACQFRDLCRFGKSASIKYVLRDGNSLKSFKPSPGKTVMPWD